MARDVAEWIGRTDNSMPTIKVLLRLYERQNGLCACGCGTWMDLNVDQIDCDHTVPLKDGGENRESNLQALLRRHHITKTNAENTARAIAERHKAKAFKHERRSPRALGGGNNQRTATRPILKFSPIDGVYEIEGDQT